MNDTSDCLELLKEPITYKNTIKKWMLWQNKIILCDNDITKKNINTQIYNKNNLIKQINNELIEKQRVNDYIAEMILTYNLNKNKFELLLMLEQQRNIYNLNENYEEIKYV